MPRGHFLFRSAGKGSKRGRSDRRDGRLCTAHRQQEALMHVRTRSANLPKLAALLQKAHAHSGFKHMERFPHSSHAVRCYKCCLGLPLAFCAAFRCSLRWRFTTRLFVHVFLPFGFFDKLCFKHFVWSYYTIKSGYRKERRLKRIFCVKASHTGHIFYLCPIPWKTYHYSTFKKFQFIKHII